ncbi:MAG: response regulator transcription factor [Candidatus Obscuribacterales bacterium]|nr:response regulator transcription factor [Candidatus Obscuribacterales bacterium]
MKNSSQKIMLVDDDETIVETLDFNLSRQGFAITIFRSGHQALSSVDSVGPDLIILDWMLPDMVGPEICKVLRSRALEVPILMLTGRATPNDVAEGLTAGADDYLAKPFSTVELLARVQALLRRAKGSTRSAKLVVGALELDEDARSVKHEGKDIDVSPKEFNLLKVLMLNAGKTMSTEVLLNQVWGYDFSGDAKTVAVHVRWLRQKLEKDPKNPELLETVHRLGYRLNQPKV